jgi:hypothetical protein
MLTGNKTYIVAALIAVVTVVHSLGYIDTDTWTMLLGLLNGAGISTLGAKANRIEQKTEAIQNKM